MSERKLESPVPARFESRECAEAYLDDMSFRAAASTQRLLKSDLVNSLVAFTEEAGIVYVDDITPRIISLWLKSQVDRGLAQSTIRKRWESARGFFNWCIEQDYLTVSPVSKVNAPRLSKSMRVGYSDNQIRQLLHAAAASPGVSGIRDRAMVTVLIGTGARASELCKMQFADLDRANRRLVLHGKGDKERVVPIGLTALRALNDWMQVRYKAESPYIWITQRLTPMSYSTLNGVMRVLEERTGITPVQPHRFRHTFASEYYRRHRDVIALQGLLGHERLDVTEGYLRSLGINYAIERGYTTPDDWMGMGEEPDEE